MKKIDSILADLEKLTFQTSISGKQIDKLIDSLVYTPFKQYLLCLKVGVKPEDATAILLKRVAEDIFEKTPFTEMRLRNGISETALQETVNQPVLLIAKSLFKVSKNEKGEVNAFKLETLPIENYESSVISYLNDNEFIVITNFKEVFVFDKEAIEDFKPIQQLNFGEFITLSIQKSSIADLVQIWQDEYDKIYIIKQLSKTFKKYLSTEQKYLFMFSEEDLKSGFAEGEEEPSIDEFKQIVSKYVQDALERLAMFCIFINHLQSQGILANNFLKNLYDSHLQLWETSRNNKLCKQFIKTIDYFILEYYALIDTGHSFVSAKINPRIEESNLLCRNWIEQAIGIVKNEKIKSLSDYNYRKINEYALGKAFENLHDINNDFPEEIYDAFCEKLIKQLFENQIDEIVGSINKNHLKKAKQQFEEIQKTTIFNPFFESGILLSKLLKLIFKQYQRIGKHIDNILNEKQSLLDKDENWKKLADLKKELGFNDLRKFITNIIHHQLFISHQGGNSEVIKKEQLPLLKIAKLNLYLSAIKLAPSAFHFKKAMPEEEKKAFAKFEYNLPPPPSRVGETNSFSSGFFLLPSEKWKNKEYKTLIKNYFDLINDNGFFSIVLPSQVLFNDTDAEIRHLLFVENTLLEVKLFEQGKTEWCLLFIKKAKPVENQFFSFTLSPTENAEKDLTFTYFNHLIKGFSPDSFNLIRFNQEIDYQICSKIKGNYPTFAESGFQFKNEFKITNDSNFFLRSQEENTLPLYEAKNIEHYTFHKEVKYFIPKDKAHIQLLTREINQVKKNFELSQKNYELIGIFNEKNFLLNYQTYRLVVNQSFEKTQVTVYSQAVLLPPYSFVENSLLYLENFNYEMAGKDLIQNLLLTEDALLLLALLNSFSFNFYAKTIGLKDIHTLPLPKISQDLKQQIVEKTFIMLYNLHDFQVFNELRKLLNLTNVPSIPQPLFSEVRLDLEKLIAQEVFGLTEEEFVYVSE